MECKYTHCNHNTREIKDGEEFVKIGQWYYHKDCNNDRVCINQIIDVWKRSVDPHPIMGEIRRAINNIIKNYNIRPQQLLFQLIWCLNNGWDIKHTNGIYYVVKCDDALAAYKAANTPKFNDTQFIADEEEKKSDFEYKPQKVGFGKILK